MLVLVEEGCALLDVNSDGDEEADPPPGVDATTTSNGSATLIKGLSLGSEKKCVCECDCIIKSVGDSSPSIVLSGGPEKSNPPKKGRQPSSSRGVTDSEADGEALVSMKLSIVLIRFFSLVGRPSSVSRHWMVSSNVSSSSAGRLRCRVKKVSIV